jgi:hypothetical protein
MTYTIFCKTCGRGFEAGMTAACPTCGTAADSGAPPADDIVLEVVEPSDDVLPVLEVVQGAAPPVARPAGPSPPAPAWLAQAPGFLIGADSRSAHSLTFHVLHSGSQEELAYTSAVSDPGGALLFFGGDRASSPCTVSLYDARTEKAVLTVQRSAFRRLFGMDSAQVELFDGRDRPLASFAVKPFPAKGRFWVAGRAGRRRVELDGVWSGSRLGYCFLDRRGEEIARVRGEGSTSAWFSGSAFSWCKRGGRLRLSLRRGFADDAETRLILLGTALAMELLVGSVSIRPPFAR